MTPERLEEIRRDVATHYAEAIIDGRVWLELVDPTYEAQAELLTHIDELTNRRNA